MALSVYGSHAASVFRLLGSDENSGTYALGWALEQSPTLLKALLHRVFGRGLAVHQAQIDLQRHDKDGGFTDVEIMGEDFHLIIEAKRGASVAGDAQISKYLPRLRSDVQFKCILSISYSSELNASRRLPEAHRQSVPHISWDDLRKLAIQARAKASSYEEKMWLRELIEHYKEYSPLQRVLSNQVYMVVLSPARIHPDDPYSYIDVVKVDGHYYHPIGKSGWPEDAPNYIGFRFGGRLQSIHHIESYQRVKSPSLINPRWTISAAHEFVVYKLGPAMVPAKPLVNGKIYPTSRFWCAIDTLLSGAYCSIAEARSESERRRKESS